MEWFFLILLFAFLPTYIVVGLPIVFVLTAISIFKKSNPILYPIKKYYLFPALLAHGWKGRFNPKLLGVIGLVETGIAFLLLSGTVYVSGLFIKADPVMAFFWLLSMAFIVPFFFDLDLEKYATKK
ncbi:hypothetical protein [Marasmitruncus massiliensis]|uniref:hypothetical protein n=1 Tax=Marasmitruncus massiliensis TaxID=1944642 RepID=UPI000C7D1DA7|nr:hypothetical protein [Marasmitruncus massiliensis]